MNNQHFMLCHRAAVALFIAMVMVGCSKNKQFAVSGTIDGLGNQIVSLTYYTDGGMKRESAAAVESKFVLHGVSDEPTLCIVETGSGIELATLVVSNGDKITLEGSVQQPWAVKVKGNSPSAKIAEWVTKNAAAIGRGDAAAINASIADYVKRNASDVSATALLVTQFRTEGYEGLADSLLTVIKPEARTAPILMGFNSVLATQLTKHEAGEVRPMSLYLRTDTTEFFNPSSHTLSLLAFRSERSTANDSVVTLLRELSKKYPARRVEIIDISSARDSASWKRATARDSASWNQVWTPGSVASQNLGRLNVPRLPYFVVADSTGQQVLRTSSVSRARRFINDHAYYVRQNKQP